MPCAIHGALVANTAGKGKQISAALNARRPCKGDEAPSRIADCLELIQRYRERMSLAKKLLHTRYRVNDLERTVRFYRDVLGLNEVRRHKSPRGSELVFLKAPGSEELIELCSFPASGPVQVQPDLTHLAFEVDSLEEFGRHLARLELQYSDGPHIERDGSGFAFIDAPEGYEIELMQPGKPGG